MKKNILGFALIILMMTCIAASAQENKKASDARKDIKEAQQDLVEAKKDSAADFQQFKKESLQRIAENKTKIAALKVKKIENTKQAQLDYNKKVLALEKKNDDLKKRIDESNTTDSSMWSSFKREFSHDMNELGNAFREIGVDNKK